MSLELLAAITPDTELTVPIVVLCGFLGTLIAVTWRLANRIRDLNDAVRNSWTLRDMERFAIELERENRERGNKIWVPDVKRAPKDAPVG